MSPPEAYPLQKGHADAHPRATAETVVEHAGGILRGRSPEPQAGPWHGLLLFVILLVVLGLLWLIKYLPERTYLVHDWPPETRSLLAQAERSSGGLTLEGKGK
jgi:hypothetical protein